MKLKRVLAINDISCVGRCSLTVALPMISGAGIECSILPTAVLSTHTGGFSGYTVCDLNDQIIPIKSHWESIGLKFDCMFSGYLASDKQIDNVLSVFEAFKTLDNRIVADPAMADNGKLYPAFDESFPDKMAKIVAISDVCLPNITEACFLTHTEYKAGVNDKSYYISLIEKLHILGAKNVVLTGVMTKDGFIGVAVLENGVVSFYEEALIPHFFHGTGDVFASAFVSAYTLGKSILSSAKIAVKITRMAIEKTIDDSVDSKYGVNFEETITTLRRLVRDKDE